MLNLFILANNLKKISSFPFNLEKDDINSNNNENYFRYFITNDFHFNLKINKNDNILLDIVSVPNDYNYKQVLYEYQKPNNKIKKICTLSLKYENILKSNSYFYSDFIYKDYPYQKLIYQCLNKYLPNEIINLILKLLKLKIHFCFYINNSIINNNSLYLSKPSVYIPNFNLS